MTDDKKEYKKPSGYRYVLGTGTTYLYKHLQGSQFGKPFLLRKFIPKSIGILGVRRMFAPATIFTKFTDRYFFDKDG